MDVILDELMIEIIRHCSAVDIINFSIVNKRNCESCDWELLYDQHFKDSGMIIKGSMNELFIRCYLLTRFCHESEIELNKMNIIDVVSFERCS